MTRPRTRGWLVPAWTLAGAAAGVAVRRILGVQGEQADAHYGDGTFAGNTEAPPSLTTPFAVRL